MLSPVSIPASPRKLDGVLGELRPMYAGEAPFFGMRGLAQDSEVVWHQNI